MEVLGHAVVPGMSLRLPGGGAGDAFPLSAHDAWLDETMGRVEGCGSRAAPGVRLEASEGDGRGTWDAMSRRDSAPCLMAAGQPFDRNRDSNTGEHRETRNRQRWLKRLV